MSNNPFSFIHAMLKLSSREGEELITAAVGLTNGQIAEELFLSVRLFRILRDIGYKLGLKGS